MRTMNIVQALLHSAYNGGRQANRLGRRLKKTLYSEWMITIHGSRSWGRELEQMFMEDCNPIEASQCAHHPGVVELLQDIAHMASKAGIPAPALWICHTGLDKANPVAAGYRSIFINPQAFELYTREEVKAIVGHEMAHVIHGDFRHLNNIFSRWLAIENRADKLGMRLSGNPAAFASALRKAKAIEFEMDMQHAQAQYPELDPTLLSRMLRRESEQCAETDMQAYPAMNRRIRRAEGWAKLMKERQDNGFLSR